MSIEVSQEGLPLLLVDINTHPYSLFVNIAALYHTSSEMDEK